MITQVAVGVGQKGEHGTWEAVREWGGSEMGENRANLEGKKNRVNRDIGYFFPALLLCVRLSSLNGVSMYSFD